MRRQSRRQIKLPPGKTRALNAPIASRRSLPSLRAGDIELAIERTERSAHHAGSESARQRHDSALRLAVYCFAQDKLHAATSEREIDQFSPRHSPTIAPHPHLASGRIVDHARNPAERQIVTERTFCRDTWSAETIIAAGPDHIDVR